MQPNKGYDIKQDVRQQILSLASYMEPQNHGKLPSETKLADQFGVSRLTVRTVLAELAAEGIVRRKHGVGTFAVSRIENENVICFHSCVYFEQVIRFFGLCPRVEIEGIKLIPADAEASARLSLRPGEKIVQVRKMFYGDEHLAVHNVMIIPARYVKKEDLEIYLLPRDAIWEMVDRIASRKGVARLECEIMQISATNCARTPELLPYMHEEEADIHPFIVLQTVFRDVNQEPLLFSTCYINADIITFGAILSPPRE